MTRPTLFSLLISIVILSSCADDDTSPLDRSSLIAGTDAFGKTWSITGIEVPLGTITPKTCVTDNFITYYPNGRYEINEGASKCDPNDPLGLEGTWEFTSSETKLVVQIGDSTQVWEIEALNQNNHTIISRFTEGERSYSLTTR